MKTTSALKRLIGRVLIGVFVYTQLAVAAYACAGLPGMVAPGQNQSGPTFSAMAGHSQASV